MSVLRTDLQPQTEVKKDEPKAEAPKEDPKPGSARMDSQENETVGFRGPSKVSEPRLVKDKDTVPFPIKH